MGMPTHGFAAVGWEVDRLALVPERFLDAVDRLAAVGIRLNGAAGTVAS